MRCNLCGGIVELVDDNGAEFPETRIERYRCEECGEKQAKVLTP